MEVRRCPARGRRTRAGLPAGVPLYPFAPSTSSGTAVVALLTGRYRLSRREVQPALGGLVNLWGVVTVRTPGHNR